MSVKFRICVHHPILDYIVWNEKLLIADAVIAKLPQDCYRIGRQNGNQHFWEIVAGAESDVVVTSLDFFSYGVRFDGLLSNDLNYNDPKKQYRLEDYFTFSIPIPQAVRSYVCIHLRMGDRHANIIPVVEYCDGDDRSVGDSVLLSHVENIIGMIDQDEMDILFLSDDPQTRQKLLTYYPTRLKTDVSPIEEESDRRKETVILNISYPIHDESVFKRGIEQSIYEFEILRRAQQIYSLSYSGFATIAHYLRTEEAQEFFRLYQ
jgi:hypothetical protein